MLHPRHRPSLLQRCPHYCGPRPLVCQTRGSNAGVTSRRRADSAIETCASRSPPSPLSCSASFCVLLAQCFVFLSAHSRASLNWAALALATFSVGDSDRQLCGDILARLLHAQRPFVTTSRARLPPTLHHPPALSALLQAAAAHLPSTQDQSRSDSAPPRGLSHCDVLLPLSPPPSPSPPPHLYACFLHIETPTHLCIHTRDCTEPQ